MQIHFQSIKPIVVTLTAIVLSVGVALTLSHRPIIGLVFSIGLFALCFFTVYASNVKSAFSGALSIGLLGYMFLDRGFAYVGIPPAFIGELLLLLALMTIICRISNLRSSLSMLLLLGFIFWGAARTIPYISSDGLFALRDGVLWAYALIAIAVFLSFDRTDAIRAGDRYGRIARVFLVWVPVALILQFGFSQLIPRLPVSDVPLLRIKPGDLGIHLAGVAAFVLLGVTGQKQRSTHFAPALWIAWFAGFAVVATLNRGGFLSILFVLGTIFLVRPSSHRYLALAAVLVLGIFLTIANPTIDIGRSRSISPGQITANLQSVFTRSDDAPLQGTVNFRLDWWQDIWDDTVRGQYFWTGRGFGANLSTAYGIRIEEVVRSPHNSHIAILARMGVPGLLLWIGLNLSIAFSLVRIFFQKSQDDPWLSAFAGWLLMYWSAIMVNTSFDSYLEGPQGGIWYWSIVGLSLLVIRLEKESCHVAHFARS